jgi:hypothetical protein
MRYDYRPSQNSRQGYDSLNSIDGAKTWVETNRETLRSIHGAKTWVETNRENTAILSVALTYR